MTAHKFSVWCFYAWLASVVGQVIYASSTGESLPIPLGLIFFGAFTGYFYDWGRARGTLDDRALFLTELADLLKMGMSTKQALGILKKSRQRELGHRFSEFGKVVGRVADRVDEGSSLAEAFESSDGCPSAWSVFLEHLEQPDQVSEVLRDLAESERSTVNLPLFSIIRLQVLTVILAGVTMFLRDYIMPTFVELFKGMNLSLPWGTRVLLASESGGLGSLVLRAVGLIIILMVVGTTLKAARPFLMRIALYLPGASQLIRLHCQSRIFAVLGLGVKVGVPADICYREASRVADVKPYQLALKELQVKNEPSISTGLSSSPQLFSPAFLWLLEQGEQLENLPEALETASVVAAAELTERAKRAATNLDTFLLVAIGAFVGFVVISVFLPLYQLIGNMT